MRVFRSLEHVAGLAAGGSLTIGNFDGVHVGHRGLIGRASSLARPAVVVTFHPHPMVVLNPRQAPAVLTPLELKLELFAEAGADAALVLAVDSQLLSLSPEQFVQRAAVQPFAPSGLVEGPDFGFGRGRSGDVDTLARLGLAYNFRVEVVDHVVRTLSGHHEPVIISSTLVRRLISGGAVEAAAECLGRPYRLLGRPIRGRGQGRRIGFPTVNLDVGEQLAPADGVYAAIARCDGHHGPAAVSIGPAPTFDFAQSAIEAHLLDFDGEISSPRVALDLHARLRGIEKFQTVEQLTEQVRRDVQQVRAVIRG